MATITLNGITGATPYNITVCDGFGNNCVYFPNISLLTPFTLSLPAFYDSAPITMVTITDVSGCSRMELFYCDDAYPEYICFNIQYNDGVSTIDYPISLQIDENINNIPSYVGDLFGSNVLMFWTGANWVIQPFGYTTPIGPDLFYGVWGTIGLNIGSLSNTYCPSICVFTDDGIVQSSETLQYIIYTNYPPGNNLTSYQNITANLSVEWNSGLTQWEYYESNVLIATLSGTEDVTPLGGWVLEVGAPYNSVVTSLICPVIDLSSKQFQDDDYFFFQDGELYNFQN